MTQAPFRDPIAEARPNVRLPSHPGEHDARPCPHCAQPLDFLHYDQAEIPVGHLFAHGLFSGTELLAVFGILLAGVIAMLAFGTFVGMFVFFLAVPVAVRWQRRREVDRAVWRCAPCDRYWRGTHLEPWKPPAVSRFW
jgi:hypothetical protein